MCHLTNPCLRSVFAGLFAAGRGSSFRDTLFSAGDSPEAPVASTPGPQYGQADARRYDKGDPNAFILGDTEEGALIDYLALDHYYEMAEPRAD